MVLHYTLHLGNGTWTSSDFCWRKGRGRRTKINHIAQYHPTSELEGHSQRIQVGVVSTIQYRLTLRDVNSSVQYPSQYQFWSRVACYNFAWRCEVPMFNQKKKTEKTSWLWWRPEYGECSARLSSVCRRLKNRSAWWPWIILLEARPVILGSQPR
jgi:hypothetical protein